MAFSSIAALVGGQAATATLVLSAVAEVGLAMTMVGAVTGNKKLLKIGGTLGLIGGVGSMVAKAAASAGAAVAGEAVAGGVAAEAAGSELAGEVMSKAALDGTTSFGSSSVPGAFDIGAEAAAGSSAPLTNLAQDVPTTGAQAMAEMPTLQQPAASTPSTGGEVVTPNTADVNRVVSPADYDVGGRFGPDNIDVGGGWSPASAPQASTSFWTSMTDWAKNNKALAGGAMMGISSGYAATKRYQADQRMNDMRQTQLDRGNQVGVFAPRGIVNGAIA